MRHGSYDKLDDDGLAPPISIYVFMCFVVCSWQTLQTPIYYYEIGTKVSGEDVIIGKTTPISQEEAQGQALRYTRRDHNISLRHTKTIIFYQVSL